ncbi:MAG TPA: hypothetical protein VK826_15570 [Bacteroidia bacterium]|nr:hypothetical protein [Bacteroidia bacterium]
MKFALALITFLIIGSCSDPQTGLENVDNVKSTTDDTMLLNGYSISNSMTTETDFLSNFSPAKDDTTGSRIVHLRIMNNPFNLDAKDTIYLFKKEELFCKSPFSKEIFKMRISPEYLNHDFVLTMAIRRGANFYMLNTGQNTVKIGNNDNCADLIFMPTNEYEQIYFKTFYHPFFDPEK